MNEKVETNEVFKASAGKNHVPPLEGLIADLVHELNNPLAAILGYSELILPKIEDLEIKKEIEIIRKEGERASHIVKNLVAFTQKRKPRKERVDLNQLIEEVFKLKTDELTSKNIRLTKALSPSLPPAMADPEQIKQVFINMIDNAEEAISQFHGFGEILAKTRVTEGQIELTFSDDGPGIRKEDILNMFNLLFTTKDKGVGLGLPISHHIIVQHEGRMWAESEWGKGATFFISLPMVEEEKGKTKSARAREDLRGLKGLVIDDELSVLTFVSNYLVQEGAKIEKASDVESALRIIEKKGFDFVVCDMRMPGMDGEGFYSILGKGKPALRNKIIFSTGDVMSRKTKAFMSSIKNPWIEKPFNLKRLKEAVIDLVQPTDS